MPAAQASVCQQEAVQVWRHCRGQGSAVRALHGSLKQSSGGAAAPVQAAVMDCLAHRAQAVHGTCAQGKARKKRLRAADKAIQWGVKAVEVAKERIEAMEEGFAAACQAGQAQADLAR